ncbi:PDDEXK nuclease domain-containing protein [Tunturiibacter gelidiferens]|uniref:PDDEXK nuclease domain-containing protein n=1 Tax=Tunturiibacter gelidiferens TaxID=3069689 RepID=UPI003C12C11F
MFFHCGPNCSVAIELKAGRFEPEYLGKLAFYLAALDRDLARRTSNPFSFGRCSLRAVWCSSVWFTQQVVDMKTTGSPHLFHRTVSLRRCIFSMHVAANAVQPV